MVIYLRGCFRNHANYKKFRSHIIILMVIYFLQVYKFLPGIQKLQRNLTATIEGWVPRFNRLELSDFDMTEIMVNKEQTQKMLLDFFKYYSTFCFVNYAVCPYLGTPVTRSMFSCHMPPSFTNLYFHNSYSVIQDFIVLNDNKVWQLTSFDIDSFKTACKMMLQ